MSRSRLAEEHLQAASSALSLLRATAPSRRTCLSVLVSHEVPSCLQTFKPTRLTLVNISLTNSVRRWPLPVNIVSKGIRSRQSRFFLSVFLWIRGIKKLSRSIMFTLRASCGAVYCNRSCLWVCVWGGGGFVCLWVCYHDNSKLRASILTKLHGFVGKVD